MNANTVIPNKGRCSIMGQISSYFPEMPFPPFPDNRQKVDFSFSYFLCRSENLGDMMTVLNVIQNHSPSPLFVFLDRKCFDLCPCAPIKIIWGCHLIKPLDLHTFSVLSYFFLPFPLCRYGPKSRILADLISLISLAFVVANLLDIMFPYCPIFSSKSLFYHCYGEYAISFLLSSLNLI